MDQFFFLIAVCDDAGIWIVGVGLSPRLRRTVPKIAHHLLAFFFREVAVYWFCLISLLRYNFGARAGIVDDGRCFKVFISQSAMI
jgi:hypothetical protein